MTKNDELLEAVKWDERGLCAAVAQDRLTGRVQMVAWMDREALRRTLSTGVATFFSRSRNALWVKGETSGHTLAVESVHLDCDGDTLIVLVEPRGPSCHTGAATCFFRRADAESSAEGTPTQWRDAPPAGPLLLQLGEEIESRKSSSAAKSYTRALLDGGAAKIGEKLREEADELARAIADESPERVANEAADVLYHLMVGLASRDVDLRAVLGVLAARRGVSGIAEKAARRKP